MSTSFLHGENGTLQHSWDIDSNWSNTLTQLSFQLVRNYKIQHNDLLSIFRRLLEQSKHTKSGRLYNYILRLVLHTRDIKQGKGERDLYYTLLKELADNGYLNDALSLFHYTCSTDLGSWKDVKYLVDFICKACGNRDELLLNEIHPLAQGALQILASQIEKDYRAYQEDREGGMSLAARWAPRREKGRFARVTRFFVQTIHISKRYSGKSMRDVRQMLAILNRDLDTPQINMCEGTWRDLNFNTMTSYTLLKHQKAFLNQAKDGSQRSALEDRVECANQYQNWLSSKEKKMNVSTIFPFEFVRNVMNTSLNGDEMVYFNEAWNTQTNEQLQKISNCESPCGVMIPMIDVSGSMTCDNSLPLLNAIALGIRLTELNVGPFHNKAITFESSPKWANYNDQQTFVEKVNMTRSLGWGGSTNFDAALNSILNRVIQTNMCPLAVQNMSLVVLSDMQIDYSSEVPYSTVYERFTRKFRAAGLKSVYKTPFVVPHIVFWNLRKTDGFPTMMNQPGATTISGYNANMINVLLTKGVAALRQMTPWSLLHEILDDSRYDHRS